MAEFVILAGDTPREWLDVVQRALDKINIDGVPFIKDGKLFIRVLGVDHFPLPDKLDDLVPE